MVEWHSHKLGVLGGTGCLNYCWHVAVLEEGGREEAMAT